MTKKRVLILWADSKAANLGLRVLAQGNAEIIRTAFGSENVEVECQDFGPGDSDVSFGTKAILRDMVSRNGPIKNKLRHYDLVVDSGAGDSFSDIYGLKRLSFIFYAHTMMKRLNIPVIFGPQTVGPFQTRIGQLGAKRFLKRSKLVLARDRRSAEVAKTLGATNVQLSTDVVFTLPENDVNKSRDVIVNVSGLLWFGDTHLSSAHYRQQTIALIRALKQAGFEVSIMPHVVRSPSGNDDLDATRELISLLESDVAVELVIPEDLNDARRLVASARVVVGARMHACLNALSVGTPAIPWAYSRKFAPLLEDIGWEYCIDIRDSPEPANLTLSLLKEEKLHAMQTEVVRLRQRLDEKLKVSVSAIAELNEISN